LIKNYGKIMSVIVILIAASLVIALAFLIIFIWSVKNGQYDDDYTPSVRILLDDAVKNTKEAKNNNKVE